MKKNAMRLKRHGFPCIIVIVSLSDRLWTNLPLNQNKSLFYTQIHDTANWRPIHTFNIIFCMLFSWFIDIAMHTHPKKLRQQHLNFVEGKKKNAFDTKNGFHLCFFLLLQFLNCEWTYDFRLSSFIFLFISITVTTNKCNCSCAIFCTKQRRASADLSRCHRSEREKEQKKMT